jgi:hypothetical protein
MRNKTGSLSGECHFTIFQDKIHELMYACCCDPLCHVNYVGFEIISELNIVVLVTTIYLLTTNKHGQL